MKKLIIVIVSTLILFGCSVKPVRFKGPNGNIAYSMKCSVWPRTMEECYKIASAICSKGYEIIHISSYGEYAPTTMAIECKELKF